MIKFEKTEVWGWEHAIRGMRNPLESWDNSDTSYYCYPEEGGQHKIGKNDLSLMKRLIKAGTSHRKFLRQIFVSVDITAPLYWWKECETYKVGTVSNSCSTMHTIHKRDLTLDDFSHENLALTYPLKCLDQTIYVLNELRKEFLETGNKYAWYSMIQLLPSSYNQKRTITMSYENLIAIWQQRRNHKLQEWRDFCEWIKTLPQSELLTGDTDE